MKINAVLVVCALAIFSDVRAGEKKSDEWEGAPPKPLNGDYQVYGGTLSEMLPPTKKDRKIAFMFKGGLARDLFNQIGPDSKDTCSAANDYRERARGDISCTYTSAQGYSCYLGLNVVTGKSTQGSIC
jgi:hypothetical protein